MYILEYMYLNRRVFLNEVQIFVKDSKRQKDVWSTSPNKCLFLSSFFVEHVSCMIFIFSVVLDMYSSNLVVKSACIGAGVLFGFFFVLRDKECFFSALQAHYLKVGRVLSNNGFLTGGGDFVISGNCCRFVRGRLVWCGVGVVYISALLDGACSGRIFLSK